MNSPISTKTGGTCYAASTPKNARRFFWAECNEGGSPKLCGYPERTEVFGWDESPEPLRLDCKLVTSYARKRLDSADSPVSSKPKKCRVAKLSTKTLPPPELNNDLSAINDLAIKVLSRSSSASNDVAPLLQDDFAETLIACTQQAENINNVNKDIKQIELSSVREDEATPSVPDFQISRRPLCSKNGVMPTVPVNSEGGKVGNFPKSSAKPNSATSSSYRAPIKNPRSSESRLSSNSSSKGDGSFTNASLSSVSVSCSNMSDRIQPLVTSNPMPPTNLSKKIASGSKTSSGSSDSFDNSFEQVLRSFREEEDDWLSQVFIAAESKNTPGKSKGGFVRSRSFNQMESPGRGNLRRTSSFQSTNNTEPQPLKKQKSFHVDEHSTAVVKQCSLADIERKRLEAKFRRQFREIEQKRLEAQKKRSERLAVLAKNVESVKR